jgi:hypothetical protein
MELGIAHALSVGLEIMKAAAGLVRTGYLTSDRSEEGLKFSAVEFFFPAFGPLSSSWVGGAIENFAEIAYP